MINTDTVILYFGVYQLGETKMVLLLYVAICKQDYKVLTWSSFAGTKKDAYGIFLRWNKKQTLEHFKNGPTPASFCLFPFFSTTILQIEPFELGRGGRRRARWPLDHHHHHGPKNWEQFSSTSISRVFKILFQCQASLRRRRIVHQQVREVQTRHRLFSFFLHILNDWLPWLYPFSFCQFVQQCLPLFSLYLH